MATPVQSDDVRERRPPAWRAVGLAGLMLTILLVGCTASESFRDTAAPVVLVAGDVTPISDPFGDVLTTAGTIPDDSVEVDFIARLKNGTDPTAPALQDVVVQRYEVTFRRTDGGSAVPAGFQRGMNALVQVSPSGQTGLTPTTVSLTLVPSTIKSQPPLSHLIDPGFEPGTGFVNIQMVAQVRFFGETIAGDPVATQVEIGIDFADFADDNQ